MKVSIAMLLLNAIPVNICYFADGGQVFRQDDADFVKILNQARIGVLTDESVRALAQCRRELPLEDGRLRAESLITISHT